MPLMMMPDTRTWVFPFTPLRAVDGDTIEGIADLGFGVRLEMTAKQKNALRLAGIDCDERGSAQGELAKQFTHQWLFGNTWAAHVWPFRLFMTEAPQQWREKYGRLVGDVVLPATGESLVMALRAAGLARDVDW